MTIFKKNRPLNDLTVQPSFFILGGVENGW